MINKIAMTQDIGVATIKLSKDVIAAYDTFTKTLRIVNVESKAVLLKEDIEQDSITLSEFIEKIHKVKTQISA